MGSSGDRGPCRLHAHSTAHCGAASLAFIGPDHACRSHCEVLSPNNNTPVKTGVLWGLYGWSGGPVLQAAAVPLGDHQQQVLDGVWIIPPGDHRQQIRDIDGVASVKIAGAHGALVSE